MFKRVRRQEHSGHDNKDSMVNRLYQEDQITGLTYAGKLYKRLPGESMEEFQLRVRIISTARTDAEPDPELKHRFHLV